MKHVTVYKKCHAPKCSGGSMVFTDKGYSNGLGSFWVHKCDKCGSVADFRESYPRSFNEYTEKEKETRWVD